MQLRILVLLSLATGAQACSCGGNWPSVKQAWQHTPFVFLGTVESADPDIEDLIFKEQKVRIRVDEAFKGVAAGQEIDLDEGANDCAAKFHTGQRFVFYLEGGPGQWYVPPCTHSLGDAAPGGDDLLFLHKLPKSAEGTRLSGEVELYEQSPRKGLRRVGGVADVAVKISAPGGRTTTTKTNADGAYEVYGLPPGRYSVRIDVPKGLRAVDETAVELVKDGGVSLGFLLQADTQISGHMLDVDGAPIQGVCLTLESAEGSGENGANFFTCSQEGGKYQMELMAPGKYLVVAHDEIKGDKSKTESALYYPGVRQRENATTIAIEAGHYLKDLDIRLPADEKRYRISGRMQFADGLPVAHGRVTFKSPEHGYEAATSIADDGLFELEVVAGMKGKLEASTGAFQRLLESCPQLKVARTRLMFSSVDATPIPLSSDSDHGDLKLVIDSPSCTALVAPSN